ncbi:adenylyl cyclase [Lacisediminihabitans sp. H27-G8]|uniref:adenylyl cyclase n=1 Tax=Lacisediminihabitans sp. H27-G8 TaxID=3111909 RepID=UPI0038FCFEF6
MAIIPSPLHRAVHRTARTVVTILVSLAIALSGAAFAPAAFADQGRPSGGSAVVDFGPNVKIFDPSMPQSQIQATVDAIAAQQVDNEMGTARFALLFKPGVYGTVADPLVFQVGYYTEVAGLGVSPGDVTINGHVDVYNRCFTADNCSALDNFWRSVSNLTINVAGGTDCRSSGEFWAVSQAAPMRRVDVTGGNLTFMDYCTAGPQFASGGFMADSRAGAIVNGSQQQFLVRNSSIGSWSNGVWNQVFSGVTGAPAQAFPDPTYTTLATTAVSREKPYLFFDTAKNRYSVFVPDGRTDSVGASWESSPTAGRAIPLTDFFVASPGVPVRTINDQLARGKNLLFTPGVYDIDRTISVKRANTVVLGLGVATLTAMNGAVPLAVADVSGVDVAGLMIDAGAVNSPVLLQIGTKRDGHWHDHDAESDNQRRTGARNQTAIQDVYFRIGGPHVGKATVALQVNSDNVLLDNIWAWRADHGQGVGWTANTSDTGVVINGRNVTATGLFSEHFQKYNVIWNGERGTTVFFQNELPYDAPNQAAWQHDGVLGWAGYKVADSVKTHTLWGGGSYIFTNVDPTIHATRGFEVPVTPGVQLRDLLTVQLGAGTLDHVVNDTGAPVTSAAVGIPSFVVSF